MAVQEPAPSAQPSSFGPALPATPGAVMATFAENQVAKYETLLQTSAGLDSVMVDGQPVTAAAMPWSDRSVTSMSRRSTGTGSARSPANLFRLPEWTPSHWKPETRNLEFETQSLRHFRYSTPATDDGTRAHPTRSQTPRMPRRTALTSPRIPTRPATPLPRRSPPRAGSASRGSVSRSG